MGDGKNFWTPGANPQSDWKEGLGVLLRVRWLSVIGVGKAIGIGTIWKFLGIQLGSASLLIGTSCYVALWIYRRNRIRVLQAGQSFHKACHAVRDTLYRLQLLAKKGQEIEYSAEYSRFHSEAADSIAEYFRDATGDATIGCAIRLAVKVGQDSPQYVTVGRSRRLDSSRKEKSQPVPYDQGIPDMLRRKGHVGVCCISSIEDAIKDGWWLRSPTDDLPDIRYLLIAPINSYKVSGEKKHMLGILYVTSANTMLRRSQIEPMKGFADILGMVYLLITGSFQEKERSNEQGPGK